MASRIEICVYCNERLATTRDHVLSKALFPTLSDNMITVPVCFECNQAKSRDETLLRDMLVTDLNGYEHPAAQELFKGKVKRAIGRNQSELARAARSDAYRQFVFDSKGLYLGDRLAVPVERGRIDGVLAMMVRGLLFHLTKQHIPQNYVFTANLMDAAKSEETIKNFVLLPHQGSYSWGDGVCECIFTQASDNPATTMWLLRFYRGVLFLVDTSLHGMD
jgi:hypothetical protein